MSKLTSTLNSHFSILAKVLLYEHSYKIPYNIIITPIFPIEVIIMLYFDIVVSCNSLKFLTFFCF